ncbi:MAG: hypothetical protein KBS81_09655, partial [Spirochaetales bacterium]|nr:hypothetical protein [Candidatus Physcosoma equi]
MKQNFILLLAILLPFIGGVLELFLKGLRKKRSTNLLFLAACLAVEFALVVLVAFQKDSSFTLWSLTETMVIRFHVDGISILFSVLSSFAWLLVGIFAFEYMKHEEDEERFFGFYLIVEGTLIALSLA